MVINKFNLKQKGMTFIEVLVAVFILAIGILGVVAIEASAKKGSFDSLQRSLASALAQDIIERMRANDPSVSTLNSYVGIYGAGNVSVPNKRCRSINDSCSTAELMATDLYEWDQALAGANIKSEGKSVGGLANVSGCITHASNQVQVTISWRGRTETSDAALDADCGTADNNRRQIMIKTYIF